MTTNTTPANKIDTFENGYFRITGLIHELKSLMNRPTCSLSATSLIQRECTAMCEEGSLVGRYSFQIIMYDYGFNVDIGLKHGTIRHGNFCIVFPLN